MLKSQQLTKGRFTLEASGDYRDFTLNPATIRDSHGHAYAEAGIPGLSHPIIQPGRGTARTVTFQLYLDGDLGYRARRRTMFNKPAGSSEPAPVEYDPVTQERIEPMVSYDPITYERLDRPSQDSNGFPYDINDELAWYESLKMPEGSILLGDVNSAPPVLLFSFGSRYRAFRCVMTQCDINVTFWTPELDPVKATIDITLIYKALITQSRSEVYTPGGVF